MKPVVVVNHLLEPAGKITGISSYLFSLLPALIEEASFRYVLVTAWTARDVTSALGTSDLTVLTYPDVGSQPRNIVAQRRILRDVMASTGGVVEFNPNPLGNVSGDWPRVMTVHDLYFEIAPENYPWRHRLWWKLFFPHSLARASHIICVSQETRRNLLSRHPRYESKTSVILEASGLYGDTEGCRQDRHTERYGVFVGNIAPNKGIRTLIAAMDRLKDHGITVPVYHVGRDDTNAIERAASALRSTWRPIGLGHVTSTQLRRLYEGAMFLAFPSLYEGFGLPVLEAQAAGVPVVASDIPVLREVAGDGALFFPRGDAAAMADRISTLLGDAARWDELSSAASENAARFSWSKSAQETADVFRRVAS